LRHVRSPGVKCIALTASMLAAQTTQRMYDRIVDGIASVLLTLKKRPVIRYSYTCVPLAAPRRQWRADLPGAGPKRRSASRRTYAASLTSRHVQDPCAITVAASRLMHPALAGSRVVRFSARRRRNAASGRRQIGRPRHAASISVDLPGSVGFMPCNEMAD
jgi:hypothetical protein